MAVKKSVKPLKAPTKKAAKTPKAKPAAKKAKAPTFTVVVEATMLMRAELEIEAENYDEAYEKAEDTCNYGNIPYSEFEIIEVLSGPDPL